METYFARHTRKLDVDDATFDRLWTENLVAIHYPELRDGKIHRRDNESLKPADYPTRIASILRTLLDIGANGGYVCAQYFGHPECIVGKVLPNTPVKLLRGKWGTVNDKNGRPAVLKVVRLSRVIALTSARQVVLTVGRPQQGTLRRWPSIGDRIAALVEGRKLPVNLHSLTPTQQEILCSEFLRLPESRRTGVPQLAHLLLPPGRTLKDVDILGIATDGKPIFAQVTFQQFAKAHDKLNRLRPYGTNGAHLVFFCNHDRCEIRNGVVVYPIQKAFEIFKASRGGAAWLRYSTLGV